MSGTKSGCVAMKFVPENVNFVFSVNVQFTMATNYKFLALVAIVANPFTGMLQVDFHFASKFQKIQSSKNFFLPNFCLNKIKSSKCIKMKINQMDYWHLKNLDRLFINVTKSACKPA